MNPSLNAILEPFIEANVGEQAKRVDGLLQNLNLMNSHFLCGCNLSLAVCVRS